ncbi:MAG: methionine--tRNA ligase [Candidatus Paceibacteria bacterium]
MSDKIPRYITTTLPYVNSDPHIGFGAELLRADVLARFWKLLGHEVFFNTGTDEHGQKIYENAQKSGESTQNYVDRYAIEFKRLIPALGITPEINFIRTTDAHHVAAAQEIWRRCLAAGDIYKKEQTINYCVGCELEKTDSELVDGRCPFHPNKDLEIRSEENYFFRFSKYQEKLLDLYKNNPEYVVPDFRLKEISTFVAGGLHDFSVSRLKEKMPWGVPVPDDETQVMYVWFDALTNYISALGWPEDLEGNYEKFWEKGITVQVAGKDNLRQQSAIWQAMLLSAGLPTTNQIIIGGFINSGGQKMSKSLGNVISPYELIARYGTDATRYLLLRHVHPFDDSDITWEKLDEWYTAGLVNGLGNVVARVMKMSETHLELEDFPRLDPTTLDAPETFNLQAACDHIWSLIAKVDAVIAETEPFKLIKTEPEQAKTIIANLRLDILHIGRLLLPIMPDTSTTIRSAVRANKKPDNLFNRLDQ